MASISDDKLKITIYPGRQQDVTAGLYLDMDNDIVEQVNRDVMSWAESQIDEITHLRETDTFRQEFIGNLAHELKTPIFNIQGFILTLLEGGMEDPEINRKFLLKAAKNVERMSGLLEDLDVITNMEEEMRTLDFYGVENGMIISIMDLNPGSILK